MEIHGIFTELDGLCSYEVQVSAPSGLRQPLLLNTKQKRQVVLIHVSYTGLDVK